MPTKVPLTIIFWIWSLHEILLVMEILYCNTSYGRLPGRPERKKKEILYARRYNSQDEIETLLTAILHLHGRLEKIMKNQWKQPHSIRYLKRLPPCQLAPCLVHFALLTSVRFMSELFCSGILNQHCVKWNSVRRDDVKWNGIQWSMVTQCEVVWSLVRIGRLWRFWIR